MTTAELSAGTVNNLRAMVLQNDEFVAIDAAKQVVQQSDNVDVESIIVEVYDYLWRPIGEAGDRMSLQAAMPRNEVPTVELVLKYYDENGSINYLVPYIRACRSSVVGVTIEVRGQRLWAATVDTSTIKLENSQKTLTAKCLGIYDILNYMTVWPEYLFPIWFQGPLYYAIFIGPLCTCIETMVAEQALRIQFGLNEFLNNAGSLNPDMRAWFGTWYASNGNVVDMLTTPIYVVHHNPDYDTSPTVTFNGRMDTCKALMDKATKSYGVVCTMDLWLPGDPQPDEWANLQVPTYVFRCTDRSGITGPTGGWVDGLLSQAVNFEGSVLGDVLDPWLNPTGQYAPTETLGIYIAPALGLNFVKPWAVLVDSPDGPMVSMELVDHAPQAWQIIIGGQSPQWMNDLINAFFEYIIDMFSIAAGITGFSNVLDGLFNNMLLAFQLIENYDRRQKMGPYGKPEKFIATGGAPYDVDALFSFISAFWDTRGYLSGTATFRDGLPFWAGTDVVVGALMSIALDDGTLFTEYVENLMLTETVDQAALLTVQLGDNKAEEAPIARSQRLLNGVMEDINAVLLSQGSS